MLLPRVAVASFLLVLLALVAPGAPVTDAGEALVQGDVNCSASVDSIDSLQILRGVAGLSTHAKCLAETGDVDCDGDADSTDSLRILRYVASLAVGPVAGCTPIGEPVEEELSLTSEELIAAALVAGNISYEESLLERVYAVYADPRQDARFVSPIIDWEALSELTREIDEVEAELSPALLEALLPFRVRPNDPASIFNNPQASRRVAAQGLAWQEVAVPGTNARVWAFTMPDDDMASYVDAVIAAWSGMGPSVGDGQPALFRYPRPDQAEHPDAGINPDDRIDFYFISRRTVDPRSERCAMDPTAKVCSLQTLDARGVAIRAPERVSYTSSGYLMVDEFLSGDDLVYVTAHELAHASQFSYDNQEDSWLFESTASWIGYKVMKRLGLYPDTPYGTARALYNILDKRMTMDTNQNNYGSWLFFYFASMDYGDGIVTSVWEQAALPNFDGIKAVDQVIDMDYNFDDFAVRNWNLPPVDPLYDSEDDTFPISLRPAITMEDPAPPAEYDLNESLPPLSAQYYEFVFTPEVRKVTITNFVKDLPTAHVWAIKVIQGVYHPPEDWSRSSEKTFCRDLPEEDLNALILIISNSDISPHDNPLPTTPHVEVDARAAGCQGWKGTAHSFLTEPSTGGIREVTNDANLFWEYHDPKEEGAIVYEQCELDINPCLLYFPRGEIEWRYHFERPKPPCAQDESGTVAAGSVIFWYDQYLILKPDGTGGYTYSGSGFDPTYFIPRTCKIASDYAPVDFFRAPETEDFKVRPDGRTINDSYTQLLSKGLGSVEFDWQFEYVGDPP